MVKRAGAFFVETLAGSAGLVLGVVLPVAGVAAVEWIAEKVAERRRDECPLRVDVRLDGVTVYTLTFDRNGAAELPTSIARDVGKAGRVVLRRPYV